MKIAYDAANSLDAHMVLDCLKQAGIEGRVQGEYLQGAMGELPAMGLVKVLVRDDQLAEAREIIAQWESI